MQILILFSLFLISSCGVQSIPTQKNAVEAAFAEVSNQYKRRSDLIPNLVQVVKGNASHEKDTLEAVISARAKAIQMTVDISKANPQQILEYQKAQSGLSQALGRLMVVSERYPELKANQGFKDLQIQLEGTENRIAIARRRYSEQIQVFNNLVTVPPTSITNFLVYKYEKIPQWDVDESEREKIKDAPEVKF